MNLNYKLNNEQRALIKYRNDKVADVVSEHFSVSIKAAAYIFKRVFNISSLDVDFASNGEICFPLEKVLLSINTNAGSFKLLLEKNKFQIISNRVVLAFNIEYFCPDDILSLMEYVEYFDDKIVVERFLTSDINIEIHYKKTGKVFSLQIPIERLYLIDSRYFNSLKENMTINNLIEFYRKNLLKKQNAYDMEQCDTILSVGQKTDNFMGYNCTGIKLDEAVLRNGLVLSYQLGMVNYDRLNNPVIMILKDGVYTINGYDSKNSDCLDLNQSVLLLERRKRELN